MFTAKGFGKEAGEKLLTPGGWTWITCSLQGFKFRVSIGFRICTECFTCRFEFRGIGFRCFMGVFGRAVVFWLLLRV